MIPFFEEPAILQPCSKPLRSEAATSAPPSPPGHEWLSISEEPTLPPVSWDSIHGHAQSRSGIIRGFPVNPLSRDRRAEMVKCAKFAVQGAASKLFPCRSIDDRRLVCRCGTARCYLCWAPRAGNIITGLKALKLPMQVREELDAILAEELLPFDRESFDGVMGLARRGQKLCRVLGTLDEIFGSASEDAPVDVDVLRLKRLLRVIEQRQHGGGLEAREHLLRLVKAFCREAERKAEDALRRRTVDLGGEWALLPERPDTRDSSFDALDEYVCSAAEPISRLLVPIEDTLDNSALVVTGTVENSPVYSSPLVDIGPLGMIRVRTETYGDRHRHEDERAALTVRLKKKRQVQFRRGLEAQIAEKREAVRRRVEEERLAEQEASLKEAQIRSNIVNEEKGRLLDLARQSEKAAEAIEQLHKWRLQRIRKSKGVYKGLYHDDMELQIEELCRRPDRQLIQMGYGAAIDPLVVRAKNIQREFFYPPQLRTGVAGSEVSDADCPLTPSYERVWGPTGSHKPLPDHSDREVAISILERIYSTLSLPEVADHGKDNAAMQKAGDGIKAALDWSWLPEKKVVDTTQSHVVYEDIPNRPLDDNRVRGRSRRLVEEIMSTLYPLGIISSGSASPVCIRSPMKGSTECHKKVPTQESYFVDPWPAQETPTEHDSTRPIATDLMKQLGCGGRLRRSSIGGQMHTKDEEERRKLLMRFDELNSK